MSGGGRGKREKKGQRRVRRMEERCMVRRKAEREKRRQVGKKRGGYREEKFERGAEGESE